MKVIILLTSFAAAFADGACPENQHYSSCGTACPLTCENYRDPPTACILRCNAGCHCNEGYVKTDDGHCVMPENCLFQDNYVRTQHPVSDICNLTADAGDCRASVLRYYFDKSTGQCQAFVYGGCNGNANNFRSENECEQTCFRTAAEPSKVDCSASADSGHCYASLIRYFYDQNEGTCKNFTYGGCGGNSNNFYTEEECRENCEATSVCEQAKMAGTCTGAFRRYYFNKLSGQCELFVYGGCGGNGNNFLTKEHCESLCVAPSVCEQEKKVGPCKGNFRRFYFNRLTRQCESFFYGGCRGNGNNFLSKAQCESSCSVCPENQHYDSCGSACPLTCKNYRNPPTHCIFMCSPGCHCDAGHVRDDDERCVRPENCSNQIN
ncbi:papilin-like isoform X2 [Stegodyphus dumicola]|uniref:papilin-like isoform X2 n=1 Tax=Stegodyphus dumicola TaxID=202533 RepID=UPI0015AC2E09|nr:papilin-like isoform X2 [Stegodyphus dumicola]